MKNIEKTLEEKVKGITEVDDYSMKCFNHLAQCKPRTTYIKIWMKNNEVE